MSDDKDAICVAFFSGSSNAPLRNLFIPAKPDGGSKLEQSYRKLLSDELNDEDAAEWLGLLRRAYQGQETT